MVNFDVESLNCIALTAVRIFTGWCWLKARCWPQNPFFSLFFYINYELTTQQGAVGILKLSWMHIDSAMAGLNGTSFSSENTFCKLFLFNTFYKGMCLLAIKLCPIDKKNLLLSYGNSTFIPWLDEIYVTHRLNHRDFSSLGTHSFVLCYCGFSFLIPHRLLHTPISFVIDPTLLRNFPTLWTFLWL